MTSKHVVLAAIGTVAAIAGVIGWRFYKSEVHVTTPDGEFNSPAGSTDVDVDTNR